MDTRVDLVKYDAMVSAIAECERVDEAKDIRDKAIALEAYYRQARNMEAERQACNIRLRAEDRVGHLLKELARAQGERNDLDTLSTDGTKSPYASALSDMGMSRQQAHRFQSLANVDRETFEAALASPEKPTTNGIIARAKLKADPQKPKVADEALWLWGRLRDFERMGFLENNPQWALESMTDAMHADVIRLAPHVANFLTDIGEDQ